MGFFIALGVVVLILLWALSAYNGLIRMSMKVEEAFSTMDVYLKKRFDLIPNLVNTVKGYAKHEAETLQKIIEARNSGISASPEQAAKEDNQITGALRQIFALAESYPDLKANTNFCELMSQLKAVEEDIANSRKYYNGVVKQYNTAIMVVPKNIIANMFHFEKKPMFVVDDVSERKNVVVNFDN